MREQYELSVSKLISSEFVFLVLLILSSNSTSLYKSRITVFPLVLLNCFITGCFQHFNSSKIGFFHLLSHALHKLPSHLLLTILALCICTFCHLFSSSFGHLPLLLCLVEVYAKFTWQLDSQRLNVNIQALSTTQQELETLILKSQISVVQSQDL